MERVQAVVVGAGVVGLAVARALARQGREVVLLEAASAFGSATSSRNSEVVHAGIYYAPGSLKARLCVRGRELLYGYCAAHDVPQHQVGKLIVATAAEQEAGLQALLRRAQACGVNELQTLGAAQAQALEPALHCTAALHSPRTGIIDSHAFMLSLLGQAQDHGAMLAVNSPVQRMFRRSGEWVLEVGGAQPMPLAARCVVNSAGLHAPGLAQRIEGLAPHHVPPSHWARGHYFSCTGKPAFSRLIYPLPDEHGLGIHLTLDLAGQMRFGPDVQWVPCTALGGEDYTVDPARAAAFEHSIRRYWPALPALALQPAYAGLRPKINGPHEPGRDFLISGPAEHGLPGLVNLFGIESPGLTAALAIAEEVLAVLGGAAQ